MIYHWSNLFTFSRNTAIPVEIANIFDPELVFPSELGHQIVAVWNLLPLLGQYALDIVGHAGDWLVMDKVIQLLFFIQFRGFLSFSQETTRHQTTIFTLSG